MAWYTPLKFNRDNFRHVVVRELDKAMSQAISIRFSGLDYENDTVSYSDSDTGKIYVISFEDIRAWVMFFGSGDSMVEDGNPYLEEYKNSALWNPLRKDKTVVARKKGDYSQFNYDTGELQEFYAHGTWAGKPITGGYRRHLNRPRSADFWKLLEMTYRDFLSLTDDAIKRIENCSSEYFEVENKRYV